MSSPQAHPSATTGCGQPDISIPSDVENALKKPKDRIAKSTPVPTAEDRQTTLIEAQRKEQMKPNYLLRVTTEEVSDGPRLYIPNIETAILYNRIEKAFAEDERNEQEGEKKQHGEPEGSQ